VPLSLDAFESLSAMRSACICNCGRRTAIRRDFKQSYHGQIRWHARETGGLMPACTQPGCTGRIVDGYCDVCGGPVGAAPFVPAAASAAAPVPADEPGLTAVRRGPGFPPKPKSESLMTGCPQPRCTGMIVDGYCDVCGSPAGAVPFVPAAASATSPAPVDDPCSTAVPAPTPAPARQRGDGHPADPSGEDA
jgi:hypothetical protein